MRKVGVLRGPNLNPYEGQYFEKLPQFGYQPIGITTRDKVKQLSDISFPLRAGHNLRSLTKGKLKPLFSLVGKATKYNFESWNLRVVGLNKIAKDLDIIHSADIWYPFTYQAVKTGKPTVATQWENLPFNVKGKPYLKIQEYNRKHVTHFIAITEKAKEALTIEGVNPDKISVIPAGLDCQRFKPTTKAAPGRFNVSEDKTKILFVGRLTPEKGIFDLLHAFSIVLKNHANVELLIAGTGTIKMQTEIHNLSEKLKIQGHLRFLGSVKYSEMPQVHNLADIFCLPSVETDFWAEQFGYSIVEAMATEKPVISTFTGSIPEIVKNRVTGILVEQKNPPALASALDELLLDKKERERMGRNGRVWVLEAFEANKVAKQLATVYERIV
ncbi:MAG: glycosyltransferase family 4 protein [Candidatus Bathyarchaeota archaeon]|nr:glycosyltransferase family 4 protein [Candidatus Bathyarchaeota archaeon]